MASVPTVAHALQDVLTQTAEAAARQCGVIQRRRKFTGASLCQTLVFGWLAAPHGSLSDLCAAALQVGVQVSRQGIDQRLAGANAERLAAMLRLVLQAAVDRVIGGQAPVMAVLTRFPQVLVEDSSVLPLPPVLASTWPGCGGAPGTSGAALKLALRYDLRSGALLGPRLAAARVHDATLADQEPLPAGSLSITDLGYFGLARFARLDQAGVFFLSRLRARTSIVDAQGRVWQAGVYLQRYATASLDIPVQLGQATRLPVRLLAVPVPIRVANDRRRTLRAAAQREGRTPDADTLRLCSWTVLITNLPVERLHLAEALALAHARWQIELLWKLWKTDGGLRWSRSAHPEHLLVELYAKLIGLLVQHWLLLTIPCSLLVLSRVKLAALVREHALPVGHALARGIGLFRALCAIAAAVHPGCRLTTRKRRPATCQLLFDPDLCLP